MTNVRKGIYNYNIIATAPSYKLNKHYGGIIALNPPLSLICLFLVPFYVCIKDKETL